MTASTTRLGALLYCAVALGCSSTQTTPAPTVEAGGPDASASHASDASDAAVCKLQKPYSTKNQTCNQCAEAHCCAPINACYADPVQCDNGYVDCAIGCSIAPSDAGPAACLLDCRAQFPQGAVEYDAFSACVDGACKVECK